ncbi:hypothetical protein ACFY05_32515 [Microtetraspora fusca]|uniref:Uncharacterized protein n=1 Tax=Microtetraspora fusca TaxID=1997 RepID=A0ABW6VHJ3_MICFU
MRKSPAAMGDVWKAGFIVGMGIHAYCDHQHPSADDALLCGTKIINHVTRVIQTRLDATPGRRRPRDGYHELVLDMANSTPWTFRGAVRIKADS